VVPVPVTRPCLTATLGLEGIAVLAVSDVKASSSTQSRRLLPLDVVRCAERRIGCVIPVQPGFWDLPAGGRCMHPQCERQIWTETHSTIAPRSSWTERARE
jgi:hypothetical protein